MKNIFVLSALVLLSFSGTAQTISNFRQVTPGIYRGGSPGTDDLQYLSRQGFKTIISLQGDAMLVMPSERSVMRSRAKKTATQLGMRYINAPIPAMRGLTSREDESLRRIAAVMANPSNQPVFVHCSLGDDRTGLAIAVYRVLHQGWSVDKAYQEMKAHGHGGIQKLFTPFLKIALYRIADR